MVYDTNKNYLPATQKAANSYTYLTNNMTENEIAAIDAQYAAMPTNRGCDYEIPYAFTAQSATYYRAFKTGTLATISLPYSGGELPVGVKAFKLVSTFQTTESYNNEGLWFLSLDDDRLKDKTTNEATGKLEANTPYVLKIGTDAQLQTASDGLYTTFSATNAEVPANTSKGNGIFTVEPVGTAKGWKFAASSLNIDNATAASNKLYTLRGSDKSWHPVTTNTDPNYFVHSFRGSMMYNADSQAKIFPQILEKGETPTSIKKFSLDNESHKSVIYGIDGAPSKQSSPKGVFIVNRFKVVM